MSSPDREAMEHIAIEVFQRSIEAERNFVASTLRTALAITGLALSAVLALFGFLGWQRFDDVQTEAREQAQKEVQRYISEEAALKDARNEIDRQYGEALVRTLRARDFDAEFEVSRAQVDRLLQVLLSPETEADLFEEAIEIISFVGSDSEADWFPKMQDRLIRDGVMQTAYIDVFPERRERIVGLLAEIGTKGAAVTLRQLLADPHLSSECARSVFDFERRIRLESPIDKSVLTAYMKRRGPDKLVASARALAFASYPTEKEFQDWIVPLKDLKEDQSALYALTLRNVLNDSFGGSMLRPALKPRPESLALLRSVTDECTGIRLAIDGDVESSDAATSLGRSTSISLTCLRDSAKNTPAWDFTIATGTFIGIVVADLREAKTLGAHSFASAIDRWSSPESEDVQVIMFARAQPGSASITLNGKSTGSLPAPRKPIRLTTLPDPQNVGKRLPALMPAMANEEPLAFDAMDGFWLHAMIHRSNRSVSAPLAVD